MKISERVWGKVVPVVLNRRRADLVVLGDSNAIISRVSPWSRERWSNEIGHRLGLRVANLARNGWALADSVAAGNLDRAVSMRPRAVLIAFGINDAKRITPDVFGEQLVSAVARLRAADVDAWLMTTAWVDPGHYSRDRNAELAPYNAAIRDAATEAGAGLVDVAERLRREAEVGVWDTRLRRPGDPARQYDNIHYNATGCMIVADEAVRTLTAAR